MNYVKGRRTLLVYSVQFRIRAESNVPSNPYKAPEEPTAGIFWIKREATRAPTKAESI